MYILIYIIIILAVGLVIAGFTTTPRDRLGRIPQAKNNAKTFKMQDFLSGVLPTKGFLEKTKMYAKLEKRTEAAHANFSPEGFFNLKLLAMAGLAILAWFSVAKNPIALVVALAIGYIAPDFYLRQKISKRKQEIIRRLPETVDLLGLCIEAGLDFVNAVKWIIDKSAHTPILEELAFALEEIKWGKPRVQALKDMSRRLDIPELSSFVQTIVQAERMGTPVAEAFTILSEDSRAQRFHRGERIALMAPIKILLPLIFFIMPVIGIVIGGPILIQFMQGGLGLK